MDFASQTEEEHTDVAFEKGTNTNGRGCSILPHRQGIVVGWSQGRIVSGGVLLPEHTQGVLLIATRLAREGNGWDV